MVVIEQTENEVKLETSCLEINRLTSPSKKFRKNKSFYFGLIWISQNSLSEQLGALTESKKHTIAILTDDCTVTNVHSQQQWPQPLSLF